MTVHVRRRRPRPLDVVVRWSGTHTATDLAAVLAEHLGEPVPFLTASGRTVDASTHVGMPPLVHGASLAVGQGAPFLESVGLPGTVLDLAVVGGPDSGRSCPLNPPGLHIGRSVSSGLAVDDQTLSRFHATVHVDSSGIVVEDVGSTNGVVVNGRAIDGPTAIDGSSTIVVGSSTLRVRRGQDAGLPLHPSGDGRLEVRPPAAPIRMLGAVEVESPTAPVEPHRGRIPWLGALLPVPIALALALVLGPQLLLFALLGPVALLANAVADRWGAGRAHRRATAAHAVALRDAQERLRRALRDEVARLDAGNPDPHAVLRTAERRLPGLWQGGGLAVRLGIGEVATRVAWLDGSRREHPLASGAPVVVDLADVGCLGVVGPPQVTDRLLANIVGQLCTRHPPDRLIVTVASRTPSWDWTKRMPHAVPEWSDEVSTAQDPPRSHLLVVPSAETDGVALLEPAARDGNALVVTAASNAGALPSACAAVVEATREGRHTLSRGAERTSLTSDGVGWWWADRVSRALAPLRSVGQRQSAGLRGSATLGEVLGEPCLDATAVVRRWTEATGSGQGASAPVAAVGLRADGVHRIDLRRDGPHILVGGTTGSGKSEFLRTLVTSLALGSPPTDLAFVLVDFKGGAAFGPCADLPHVVGMVTDLDDHLVARALTSLGAELRRRERIFAAAAVSDLDGYLRCRRPEDEPVPRLVLVVDELRALVDEVPEFVSGMVRLAALGRSLGVHLVLATQRPSGVVTPEIQANVNLRVAFRVRDRADSLDILDDAAAANLPPGSPGRALARGGDGTLVAFQVAVVAPDPEAEGPHLSVAAVEDSSGDALPGQMAASRTGQTKGRDAADERLSEISAIVAAVAEAQRRTGGRLPRPPWLAPLPAHVELAHPPPGGATDAGVVVGVVDEPELQHMSPLLWSQAGGSWLLVGRARSGRTTAARAVALAAAVAFDADLLHIHVVDSGGSLTDLTALPHVGTQVRADDTRAVANLVAHLREECDRRRRMTGSGARLTVVPPPASILLIVDGWEQLVEAQPDAGFGGPADELPRLLRDGAGVGIAGVITGARGLLQPTWTGLGASQFLLGTVDPLDAALAGLRSSDLPTSPPPGRAVRVADRRSVQFAAATGESSGRIAATSEPATDGRGPFVLRPLPSVIRWRDAARRPHAPSRDGASEETDTAELRLAVGVAGRSAATWAWAPERMGRRLLVAGPCALGTNERPASPPEGRPGRRDAGRGRHGQASRRAGIVLSLPDAGAG